MLRPIKQHAFISFMSQERELMSRMDSERLHSEANRSISVGGLNRSYMVHLPKHYDANSPLPVVLAFHGATMNGPMMAIEGGGHTWPGKKPSSAILGESALNISANDLMWEFFQKHPATH